ncbi:MAG: hypothetical protein HRT76_09600 [Halieaceae bacterium]|nr:hypothetical protein [Halieaceae bacterium]
MAKVEQHMTVDPERKFFVVHLQKTAGTTLRDRFRNTFSDEQIYPHKKDGPDILHAIISLSHLRKRWQERGDEIKLVAGHFPLSTTELLGGPFTTLCVLRPPLERTLSYLRHQKQAVPEDAQKPLEEIYDDPFRYNGLIRNHMTRMLGITTEQMQVGDGALSDVEDSEELLERAKRGLASLDDFGLQPRFEEFWSRLADRYGLDSAASQNSNQTRSETATDALGKRILRDNALDVELYAYAEALYADRHGQA